jgi:hypothetical protein
VLLAGAARKGRLVVVLPCAANAGAAAVTSANAAMKAERNDRM